MLPVLTTKSEDHSDNIDGTVELVECSDSKMERIDNFQSVSFIIIFSTFFFGQNVKVLSTIETNKNRTFFVKNWNVDQKCEKAEISVFDDNED